MLGHLGTSIFTTWWYLLTPDGSPENYQILPTTIATPAQSTFAIDREATPTCGQSIGCGYSFVVVGFHNVSPMIHR